MSIYAQIKTCSKCGIEKPLSEFYKDKQKKDGLTSQCIDCIKSAHELNKDHNNKRKKQYYKDNKEKESINRKQYYNRNKDNINDRQKLYYIANKDRLLDYQKEYRLKNKDKMREKQREYEKRKRNCDSLYKLKRNIRTLIGNSIRKKGYEKNTKTEIILGCDALHFMVYLESKFTEEMNWDNYGSYWDIDHIIPLYTANTEEDILRLNHYTNLQPLDSYTNRIIKKHHCFKTRNSLFNE